MKNFWLSANSLWHIAFPNRLWLRGVALSSDSCWLAAMPTTSSVLQGGVYDRREELCTSPRHVPRGF